MSEDEGVVARRIVFPTALWRVLQAVADAQGVSPTDLAVKAMRAGLGLIGQASAKPLVARLDELPADDVGDAWLEGL